MKTEIAAKTMKIIDNALTALYNLRDEAESEDIKFQIGEITNLLAQADEKALDAYLRAKKEESA